MRGTRTEMWETCTEILAQQSAMEDMMREILGRLPPPPDAAPWVPLDTSLSFLSCFGLWACIFDRHCVFFWIFYALHNVLLTCHFDVTYMIFVLILPLGMWNFLLLFLLFLLFSCILLLFLVFIFRLSILTYKFGGMLWAIPPIQVFLILKPCFHFLHIGDNVLF
jgi:hypothetical protein